MSRGDTLRLFIEPRLSAAFSWGANDCALFAADAVRAMTGADLAAQFRHAYHDARGAARLILENGGLEAICDGRMPRIDAQARLEDGDIGLIENMGHRCLAVAWRGVFVAPGQDCLVIVHAAAARTVWRPR